MTADWPTPGRDPSWWDVFAALAAEVRDRAVRIGRMIRLIARPAPPRLSDDALLDLLGEAFEVMEPVPQRMLDDANAAYTAHQLRVGGDAHAHAVAAPDTKTPGACPGDARGADLGESTRPDPA